MKEWLIRITEPTVVAIDAMAFFVVVAGTLGALIAVVKALISRDLGMHRRIIWLNYARWLVAGLTFQLAADIIESSIATTWEAVARLGAVAVIRTFLNYFLEHDVEDIRERERGYAHDHGHGHGHGEVATTR